MFITFKVSKEDAQNTGTVSKEILREGHHFLICFFPSATIWDPEKMSIGEADEDEPICMSCAASARTRAPLLMILSSLTYYTYLACIIMTPTSHLDSIYFFSFSKQLLSVSAFFFFIWWAAKQGGE